MDFAVLIVTHFLGDDAVHELLVQFFLLLLEETQLTVIIFTLLDLCLIVGMMESDLVVK